jgi:hypothetical protein
MSDPATKPVRAKRQRPAKRGLLGQAAREQHVGGLNYEEALFVAYLMKEPTFNKTAAFQKLRPEAPYTTCATRGSDFAKRPHVAKELERRMQLRVQALGMDDDYVLNLLNLVSAVSQKKRSQKKRIVDEETGEISFVVDETLVDAMALLKATELLGKINRQFVDRQEVTGANGGPLQSQVVELTNEQLKEEAIKRGLPITVFEK